MKEDIGPAEEGSHTRDLATRFWASVPVTVAFTEMGYPSQDIGLGLCEEGRVAPDSPWLLTRTALIDSDQLSDMLERRESAALKSLLQQREVKGR